MKNKFLKDLYDQLEREREYFFKIYDENGQLQNQEINTLFVISIIDKEFDRIDTLKEYISKYKYSIVVENKNFGYHEICSIHLDFFDDDDNFINKGITLEIRAEDNGAPYEIEWDEPVMSVYTYEYKSTFRLGMSTEEFNSWSFNFKKELNLFDEEMEEIERKQKLEFLLKEKEKIEAEINKLK